MVQFVMRHPNIWYGTVHQNCLAMLNCKAWQIITSFIDYATQTDIIGQKHYIRKSVEDNTT